MTSMRVVHASTRERNDVARSPRGTAIRAETASATETVSTVTWERSTRGTGRSAAPRR